MGEHVTLLLNYNTIKKQEHLNAVNCAYNSYTVSGSKYKFGMRPGIRVSIITSSYNMSSITVGLSGEADRLNCSFFPEIELDPHAEYYCALLELTTYHSIANINEKNSLLWYKRSAVGPAENIVGAPLIEQFLIPAGAYEAAEILNLIKSQFASKGLNFEYKIDQNTLKASVKCEVEIDRSSKIFTEVFGFKLSENLKPGVWHHASGIIKIFSQDVIRVKCNIVSGSFKEGKPSHVIHEFATNKVDVGYKIIEQPKNLIYLPVNTRRINYIELSLVDQYNDPIDFRGENITCRIHIKKGLN